MGLQKLRNFEKKYYLCTINSPQLCILSMEHSKVLYISQEISPYTADTESALTGRTIPQSIQEHGFEVRTFMPKYGCINERRNQLHEVIRLSGMNVVIDDTDHPLIIKVATLQPTRMQVYFIDNEDYFHHSPSKELEIISSPEDNDERIMFFAHGVIETVKKLRWEPAIIHCMGWISALVPLYIKKLYADEPLFSHSKIIYTINNDKFDGSLDPRFIEKLIMSQFTNDDLDILGDAPVDFNALSKLAIKYADAVVLTTDNASDELLEYAKQNGKPIFSYTGDATADELSDFYKTLVAEQ